MSRDEWWFDYVEDEIDLETRAEMRTLLRRSSKDQELVKSISDTKTMLKEHEPLLPRISEEQLEDLHDKIMGAIENSEIQEKPMVRLRSEQKRVIKSVTLGAVLLLAGLSVYQHLSNKSLNTQWDVSQQMAVQGQENPDELALMMSYQNEHDFFVDVASLNLDHLTKEQFESLLQSKKTR